MSVSTTEVKGEFGSLNRSADGRCGPRSEIDEWLMHYGMP
jgi:hypothetical protein